MTKNHSIPAMGMAYRGRNKSLSAQLTEFAAKRVLGRAIDVAVRHAENGVTRKLNYQSHRNSQSNIPRNKTMFNRTSTQSSAPASTRRGQQTDQEPVELWVNTVIIVEAGTEPIRIGTGRPLSTMKADKPVNTKDEDFNVANATSNALISGLHSRAAELGKGESFDLIPKGQEAEFTGITIQVYRVESDAEGDAAAKMDIESAASEKLANLFN